MTLLDFPCKTTWACNEKAKNDTMLIFYQVKSKTTFQDRRQSISNRPIHGLSHDSANPTKPPVLPTGRQQEFSRHRTCEISSSGMTDAGMTGWGWLPKSPDPRSLPVRMTRVCRRESRAPAEERPEDPPPLPPTPELQRLLESKRFKNFSILSNHSGKDHFRTHFHAFELR